MRRSLGLLAAALLLAPSAAASHFGNYAMNPVEHDDQGRSDEPDFLRTSVLGPALENKVLDLDLDGFAAPDGQLPPPHGHEKVVAPGCYDDSGRRPSGVCGLWTIGVGVFEPGDVIPPKVFGVQGMVWSPPPGGWTPTRSTIIRFLDVHYDLSAPVGTSLGAFRVDLNHKLADSGAPRLMAGAGVGLGPLVAGPAALWAWLGDWRDLNGNGVIDHLGGTMGDVPPDNEFVWRGSCVAYNGQFRPGPHCAPDPGRPLLVGYAFPGDHHGDLRFCAFSLLTCATPMGDLPGAEPACWLLGGFILGCSTDPWLCQEEGLYQCGPGDPLFGPQGGIAPDGNFDDRTGDPDVTVRGWVYGGGSPAWYYDQSLVVGHVFVAAYDPPRDRASPNLFRIAEARFLDIDVQRALRPETEDLVQARLKPALRGAYLFVREGLVPLSGWLLNDVSRGASAALGPEEDRLLDPGWSREPNTPLDQFPGARFLAHAPGPGENPGDAQHNGFLNDYTAHAGAWHAWADLQSFRELTASRALLGGPFLPSCIMCITGPGFTTTATPEPMQEHAFPRAHGDHARTLGPGIHHFFGHAGRWRDLPQPWACVPLQCPPEHTVGPDGWVGNVLNATGSVAPVAQGGEPMDTCTIAGVRAAYPWGWCHPYLDGALSDPQQYNWEHREWSGGCSDEVTVRLEPEGGVWTVPVYVWRDTWLLHLTQPPRLEDYSGLARPIELRASCPYPYQGFFLGNDVLVLPAGNVGLRVFASVSFDVSVVNIGVERVVDVDVYEPLGPPSGPS